MQAGNKLPLRDFVCEKTMTNSLQLSKYGGTTGSQSARGWGGNRGQVGPFLLSYLTLITFGQGFAGAATWGLVKFGLGKECLQIACRLR